MPFRVELDKDTGKYRLFNKDKKTYTKRSFNSKASAEKMAEHYSTFGKKTKERVAKKEEE